MADAADAVVIGAGPNGLVAANLLADAGWEVAVLEANAAAGGAVRTAEVTAPGFQNDLCSSFYPFAAASPIIRELGLEDHGLRWTEAPLVLAHPRLGGPTAVLSRDLDLTATVLDAADAGDGAAHRRLYDEWLSVADPFVGALLAPFPPLRAGLRLLARAGPAGLRELARRALVPLRRFVEEEFTGEPARLLYAGNALHADLTPEHAGGALFGWMLVALGQQHGFPVPVGGAQQITDALVRRLGMRGGMVQCGRRVERVEIRDGRAVGVRTTDGAVVTARRAVLADCDATHLYLSMVGAEHLSSTTIRRVARIERSSATFKVDWALAAPIPWQDPLARRAGTVHVTESLDELTVTSTQLATGLVPETPFLLVGQMTTADPTRSPPGTEAAWAYTHVPQSITGDAGGEGITGSWDECDDARFVRRIEARLEALAPGFGSLILARHVQSPRALEADNANLVGGDISGGTAQLHQQLVFRPIPGLARAETPVRRLYLASASAHPGGAVHGACGANAARAALLHHRLRR